MNPSLVTLMALFLIPGLAAAGLGATDPTSDPPAQPHLLLIVVDTLRADHLGCYGYDRETSPNLDALAQRGVVFERTYSTSSWTLPAVVSLMSGLYCSAHGANTWSAKVGPDLPWLAAELKQAGYRTLGVSSNPFLTRERGLGRGFDRFDDETVVAAAEWSFPLLESQYKAMVLASTSATATRRAMELLNEQDGEAPFFLLVHYMDPHADYVPPAPLDTRFNPNYAGSITGHAQSQNFPTDLPPEDLQQVKALYDGEIAHTDAHIGQLLEHLDALGWRQRTAVIVTADHGEEFLDHGAWFHGHHLFEETVRVPLIVDWPGVTRPGHRVSEAVSLVDLRGTIGGLLGLDLAPDHGADLRQALAGGRAPADRPLLMETQLSVPLRAMVRGDTKALAELRAGQLVPLWQFDLLSNPQENTEAASAENAVYEAMQAAFEQAARAPRHASKDPEHHGREDVGQVQQAHDGEADLSHADLERLRSLGYIGQ